MNLVKWCGILILLCGIALGVLLLTGGRKPEFAQEVAVDAATSEQVCRLAATLRENPEKAKSMLLNMDSPGERAFLENLENMPVLKWEKVEVVSPKLSPESVSIRVPGTDGKRYYFILKKVGTEFLFRECGETIR